MAQLTINGQDTISIGVSPFFLDHRYNIKPLEVKLLDYKAATTDAACSLKERAEVIITKIREATNIA
jgi:hypothetical protein